MGGRAEHAIAATHAAAPREIERSEYIARLLTMRLGDAGLHPRRTKVISVQMRTRDLWHHLYEQTWIAFHV
jgi:hypothetical protein